MRDWLYTGLALSHPHCVRLLDGDADGEQAYLVEEFIPGKKLSEKMAQLTDTESRVRVIGEICDGRTSCTAMASFTAISHRTM